jgi:hypothetical protein
MTSTLRRQSIGNKEWAENDEHHAAGQFTVQISG